MHWNLINTFHTYKTNVFAEQKTMLKLGGTVGTLQKLDGNCAICEHACNLANVYCSGLHLYSSWKDLGHQTKWHALLRVMSSSCPVSQRTGLGYLPTVVFMYWYVIVPHFIRQHKELHLIGESHTYTPIHILTAVYIWLQLKVNCCTTPACAIANLYIPCRRTYDPWA